MKWSRASREAHANGTFARSRSTRLIHSAPCRSCRHGLNITCTPWRWELFRRTTSCAESTFALSMTWLPWPVLTKKQWPALRYGEKRGITWEEHQAIVAAEKNPERKAFFELAWHVGAAQIDLVSLKAEDVDWKNQLISYQRRKTGTPAILRFDEEVAAILRRLPQSGPLFANWSKFTSSTRAARFWDRCQ